MRVRKLLQRKFNGLPYPNEYQECKAYYEWACLHPILREYLVKHVNEGKRSKLQGLYLNLIGLKKGLPDYQFPVPNGKYIGLWIEMKTRDEANKKQKIEQINWLKKLQAKGHYATFCFGCEDAIKVTQDYLANRL